MECKLKYVVALFIFTLNNLMANTNLQTGIDLYYAQNKYNESLSYFEKAAKSGSGSAQVQIGKMYYLGKGVSKNEKKGIELIKSAMSKFEKDVLAKQRFAQYLYGYINDTGIFVKKNLKTAARYYYKAAQQGSYIAQNNLGNIYYNEGNYKEALKWYRLAEKNGDPMAIYNIGTMYDKGRGVKQDFNKAKEWYKKAIARNNNSKAKYNLNIILENEKKQKKEKENKKAIENLKNYLNNFEFIGTENCSHLKPTYPSSLTNSKIKRFWKKYDQSMKCLSKTFSKTQQAKKFIFKKFTYNKRADGSAKPIYPELKYPLERKLKEGYEVLKELDEEMKNLDSLAEELNEDIDYENERRRKRKSNTYKNYNYSTPKYQYIPPSTPYILPGAP